MEKIRQYRKQVAWGLIAAGYLITRLSRLSSVAIFTDEAIYARWAQLVHGFPENIFIPLTDGKQPLFIWSGAFLINVIDDPLLAMRLLSVFCGGLTIIGLYCLTKELFKNTSMALLVCVLYVVSPFAMVYDRLALFDGIVGTFAVWSLYMQVLLVKYKRLDVALLTAMVIGCGLLTKSSAFLFLYMFPFSLLLFNGAAKNKKKDFIKWVLLAGTTIIISLTYYSILKLSPLFATIGQKNTTFVRPIRDFLHNPTASTLSNGRNLTAWLVGYITVPLLIFAVSALLIDKKYLREKALLLSWFVFPFLALCAFGKLIFPRYIFFMCLSLLPLAAYTALRAFTIHSSKLRALLIGSLLLWPTINSAIILFNFSKAPIPKLDRSQLIEGYAAGVGVKETVSFLKKEAAKQPIYVGTEGTFGLMPQSLQLYLSDNPNIEIEGYWPIPKEPPERLIEIANKKPVYFIYYAPCPEVCVSIGVAPKNWPVKEVYKFQRQDSSYFTMYKFVTK